MDRQMDRNDDDDKNDDDDNVPKQGKEKEDDDDDDDDKADDDKEQMAEEAVTNTPTVSPTRTPTLAPTTESPTTQVPASPAPTPAPTSAAPILNNPRPSLIIEMAQGDPPKEEATDAPLQAPVPATTAPVMGAPRLTPSATFTPTISAEEENAIDLLPETESVTVTDNSMGNATDGPHIIQLEPLYIYVTMQGESSEEGFMEVLLDYMEYNMARDFEGFQSITYGVSTFSMITKYPSVSRQSSSASFADMTPTSNITAHIHLMTATFESQPDQPDLVITEYMEMLLENEVMMQSYLESQPGGYDATILNVTLEFEDTLNPTEVVATSPSGVDGATAEEEEPKERKDNTMTILGWTLGSFFALLWIVYLHGIQSRPYHSPQ